MSKVKIPSLTPSNYVIWRTVACAAINSLNGFAYIESDVQPKTTDELKVYWEIVALLTASISRDLLHIIATETANPKTASPYRIWQAIEQHFNPRNTTSVYKLKVEFYAMKLGQDEEITRFISRIEETACKVNAAIDSIDTAAKLREKEKQKQAESEAEASKSTSSPLHVIPDGTSRIQKGDCLAVLLAGIENEYPVDHAVITRQKDITYEDAKHHVIECCCPNQVEDIKAVRDKRPVKTCKLHGEVGGIRRF